MPQEVSLCHAPGKVNNSHRKGTHSAPLRSTQVHKTTVAN